MATNLRGYVEIRVDSQGFRSLYALSNFRQGKKILELPMVAMSEPDKFSLQVLPGIHVDCSSSLAGAINHSCEPNAFVKGGIIAAWSCIEPGDQITLDYKKTEDVLAEPFDCLCGSKNCRGRIE